jgi:hypothetical protein
MSINFNVTPYFDDFNESKQFLRVLFRPGYAVQARELTQLQTILQNQISRFGNHVFKNGSMVVPGEVNFDNQVHFAKLEDLFGNTNVTSYLTQFRDKIITGQTSGVKAVVIDTSECGCMVPGDSNVATLYFKMTDTADDGETKRFIPGEIITAAAADNTTANNYRLTANQVSDISVTIKTFGDTGQAATVYTNSPTTDVLGYGTVVEVKEGIYYIDGYFVKNPELHLYVGRFTNTVTARVGFEVIEEVITPEQDATLNDNAQGSNNFAAPGAHRYKVSVNLKRLTLNTTDTIKFIELLRLKDGQLLHKVDKTSYAELEKTFARRTFDESGSYEVNKFNLTSREHLNTGTNGGVFPVAPTTPIAGITYGSNDKVAIAVDPGKAYIEGYEVESISTRFLSINRARPINNVENGHISRLDDQPIGTTVGNHILVNSVQGLPPISTFGIIYLWAGIDNHITPPTIGTTTNINKTGLIGTARIKSFQLHSSSYSSPTFKLGLFDLKLESGYNFERDVKWISDVGATNPIGFFAQVDQTTTPVSLIGTVSGTSGAATLTGVGTRFQDEYKIGDAVVLTTSNTFVGFVDAIASPTSLTIDRNFAASYAGVVYARGSSPIYNPEFQSLVFNTGIENTKTLRGLDAATLQDTVLSSTQTVRRTITATSTAGGDWIHTLTEATEFFLTDTDLSNYTLFDNVAKTVVNLTAAAISFDSESNRKTITITGLTGSRSYTLLTSIFQNGVSAREKIKTKTSYTQTITTALAVTGKSILLDHADVCEIVSVFMTPGNYNSYSSAGAINITNRFTLDSGQRLSHYQKGALVLKDGVGIPTGAIQVVYRYFAYSSTGNYFSVDSYSSIPYEDIPEFKITNPDGTTTTIPLHDVIDYRPVISGANTFTPNIPKIGTDFNTSIANYLPRWDKLILDSVGNFSILTGVPAFEPKQPEDPKEGLILGTVFLPAYTKRASDVQIFKRDNRRYTMRDIGFLERRLSNLEYYTSLNLLEKETSTFSIKSATSGLDRFKNGFLVDQFTGHGIGNVQHPDYRIAVDSAKRELRPMHFTDALDIIENLDSGPQRASRDYQRTNDLITLPYTESSFIFNPNASRTIDVNPYKIGAFKGEIELTPEGDFWKETDRRPDLNVNDDNGYDAIRFLGEQIGVTGTNWNEWSYNWTGSTDQVRQFETWNAGFEETITTQTGTQSREGIQTSLSGSVNQINYGDRVVDISYIPFIRPRTVSIIARNLKPDTKFYGFFDGIRVDSSYVKPADIFRLTKVGGAADLNFNVQQTIQTVLSDDLARTDSQGVFQPAFYFGDILKNSVHTPVVIQTVNNITNALGESSFTLTVSSATGISPGHHVHLYNFDAVRANPQVVSTIIENNFTSTITTFGSNHSKQLNLRIFKVIAVAGTTITLANINGSLIEPFDSYSTTAYPAGDGARLQRLQASGIANFEGPQTSATVRNISIINIKNGFAIGDVLTGEVDIGSGAKNRVTITSINGGTDSSIAPTMKAIGDSIRTDSNGSVCCVFNIPADRFRTGERAFKLIDNISNNDQDFDSKGSSSYIASGTTLSKERTIVNSRDVRYVQDRVFEEIPSRRTTTTTRLLYTIQRGHDPVAQTFIVSSKGGAFVSSVDLYFEEAGARPIIVELRVTNNGVPSSRVVPFTTVTKSPSEINVSANGSAATNFKFLAPVYLQDNETYAIVVRTDEPGAKIFISELGEEDLITTNIITQQPLTGSLYLSQNSQEYKINPLLDMKFKLYSCTFDTSVVADVELKANPPITFTLDENPFEFTPSTPHVRVKARNHGFNFNDVAIISGVAPGLYGAASPNGAPHTLLNGSHLVLAEGLTKDSFMIQLQTTDANGVNLLTGSTANFVKSNVGGTNVLCSRQLNVDAIYLKTNDLIFTDTSINYFVSASDAAGTPTDFLPMVANENYYFTSRKVIKSYENQVLLSTSPLLKRPSLKIRAQLRSTNPNISPVIDLQKSSIYAISNSIDNKTGTNLNVSGVDNRNILINNTVVDSDTFITGTGTITTSTSSTTVSGTSTSFTTEARVGDTIRVGDTAIGVIATITNATTIVLTANALATNASGVAYKIVARPVVELSHNAAGNGQLVTWIDAADNLLANTQIGAELILTGIYANKLDGTYEIANVAEEFSLDRYAGSADGNKVTITLDRPFVDIPTTNTMFLDVVNDFLEFNLEGTQTSSASSTSISSTADNTSRISVGDIIVSSTLYEVVTPDGGTAQRLEKKVVGTVTAVASGSITIAANATVAITSTVMAVRKSLASWKIQQYDAFVDDYAPTGSTNLANYITRTLALTNPANNIKVIFDANIPNDTDLTLYYRAWNDEVNLNTLKFNSITLPITSKDSLDVFRERIATLENIAAFKNLQIKLVFKSTNPVYIPKVKNLRVIAYS